jgi:hypothetical protein
MLDPITLYAAKVAVTTGVGGFLAAWGAVNAQAGVDVNSALTASAGIGLLAAGAWKLLSDHAAVERERTSLSTRIDALEAQVAKAETKANYERELRQRVELEAARKGIVMPSLHDLPFDRPEEDQ